MYNVHFEQVVLPNIQVVQAIAMAAAAHGDAMVAPSTEGVGVDHDLLRTWRRAAAAMADAIKWLQGVKKKDRTNNWMSMELIETPMSFEDLGSHSEGEEAEVGLTTELSSRLCYVYKYIHRWII